MRTVRNSFLLYCIALNLFFLSTSRADEALFGYVYSSDTLPKGVWEYEQVHTLRLGKARGTYRSLDLRNEIEYGITANLSAALYLNSSWLTQTDVYDPEDTSQNLPNVNGYNINGTSLEFKYRLLSPYVDPIGLAFYLEPELEIRDQQTGQNRIGRAVEFKLILHKTYLDDTLTLASNLMLEPEWEMENGRVARELWFEFTLGVSYRFVSNWWVGLEFRNHREFPDMDFGKQEHSSNFLGPTIHYGAKDYWVTLTVLPQISGNPSGLGIGADGNNIDGGSLHLGQHEKWETRLKFGINL